MVKMNASVQSVVVDLPGRPYPIEIGMALLDRLGEMVASRCPARRASIITDANVGPRYLDRVRASLDAAGINHGALTIPPGESSKSFEQLSAVYDFLSQRRHARDEPIIALGGGVVGDLTGLAAATWHRGVPFVQCPTTLEADIDASVGGKTAVNHPTGKNLIGAFHQPLFVCVDVSCLATLPRRDFVAALAESVKHAAITDLSFLEWHELHCDAILGQTPEILVELIRRNCRIKAAIVARDERETATTGVGRAALNFGHTVGHALEAESRFDLRHGEAVALGMVAALALSRQCLGLPDAQVDRIVTLLARLGLPVRAPAPFDRQGVLNRITADKKIRGGMVRFVGLKNLGEVLWIESPSHDALTAAINRIQPT